jgi:hypothetical protein
LANGRRIAIALTNVQPMRTGGQRDFDTVIDD